MPPSCRPTARVAARSFASPCRAVALLLAASLGVASCGREAADVAPPAARQESDATPASRPVPARPRVVALGDSLTAGYGLASPDEAYPAILQQRIDESGLGFEVVNMGVSGDTSAGGLRRADWALEGDVRVLVLALGGNDGLRGLGPEQVHTNLAAIIERARARRVDVLLCGMEAPPNLGEAYTVRFRGVYRDLGRMPGVVFLPFLLDGVAGVSPLNQPDGIHPNAAGAERVADLVWAKLRPMLQARTSS